MNTAIPCSCNRNACFRLAIQVEPMANTRPHLMLELVCQHINIIIRTITMGQILEIQYMRRMSFGEVINYLHIQALGPVPETMRHLKTVFLSRDTVLEHLAQ